MRGSLVSFALALSLASCSATPAGLVLIFPDANAKAAANHATVFFGRAPAGGGDGCPPYINFTANPDNDLTLAPKAEVDLTDGKPSAPIKHIPTGDEIVLVNVKQGNMMLFLHGCKTGNVQQGSSIEIMLQSLVAGPDMAMNDTGGPVDDLSSPPPDMAVHKTLSINVVEIRALLRKLGNVVVTVKDSMGATASGTSDAVTGNVRIDVTGMTAPYEISALAPIVNGYQGGVVLGGVNPTFTTDTVTMNLPVELDPPALNAANCISGTVTAGPAAFTAYGMSVNGLQGDQTSVAGSASMFSLTNLIAGGGYRVALWDPATPQLWTPAPVTSASNMNTCTSPGVISFAVGNTFAQSFSLTPHTSSNAAYTTQQYAIDLTLPASASQAAIPIVAPTTFTTNTAVAGLKLPTNATNIHPTAVVLTELIGLGTGVRAELRHNLPAASGAADSFSSGVPDPPMVSPSPTPLPAAMPLTIVATPPAGFPLTTNAFVHVLIQDAGNLYHVHIVAPAANPTTIVLPGNMLLAGNYNLTVSFVADFMPLADGTVAATLTDDWSKLIRPLAQELSESTLVLMVN